jgi:hypothetical protein
MPLSRGNFAFGCKQFIGDGGIGGEAKGPMIGFVNMQWLKDLRVERKLFARDGR